MSKNEKNLMVCIIYRKQVHSFKINFIYIKSFIGLKKRQ